VDHLSQDGVKRRALANITMKIRFPKRRVISERLSAYQEGLYSMVLVT
jgi:hypothetical protein